MVIAMEKCFFLTFQCVRAKHQILLAKYGRGYAGTYWALLLMAFLSGTLQMRCTLIWECLLFLLQVRRFAGKPVLHVHCWHENQQGPILRGRH